MNLLKDQDCTRHSWRLVKSLKTLLWKPLVGQKVVLSGFIKLVNYIVLHILGMVFVNGFALGRYAAIGPQFSLYLPAPFLVQGINNITFFEHFAPPEIGYVSYVDDLIFRDII